MSPANMHFRFFGLWLTLVVAGLVGLWGGCRRKPPIPVAATLPATTQPSQAPPSQPASTQSASAPARAPRLLPLRLRPDPFCHLPPTIHDRLTQFACTSAIRRRSNPVGCKLSNWPTGKRRPVAWGFSRAAIASRSRPPTSGDCAWTWDSCRWHRASGLFFPSTARRWNCGKTGAWHVAK